MKRLILALGVLLMVAAQASALGGPGGYLYWNTYVFDNNYVGQTKFIKHVDIYRLEVNNIFSPVGGNVRIDCITFNGNTYGSFGMNSGRMMNAEVYDPRDQGGSGTLLVAALFDNTPPSRGGPYRRFAGSSNDYQQPWDVVQFDPATKSKTVLASGRMNTVGGWTTADMELAMKAPANWGGKTSNTLSILTSNSGGSGSYQANYLYDANNNLVIDNTTSEGTTMSSARDYKDFEFGNDQALYGSYTGGGYLAYYIKVDRMWLKSDGTAQKTTYFSADCITDPLGTWCDGCGIATGPSTNPNNTRPFVYLLSRDNVAGSYSPAIFAVQDGDGDNIVTWGNPNDHVWKVWKQGQAGLSIVYSNNEYWGEDIELYLNPDNGGRTLIFSGYYNSMYALELYDNGLLAKAAKTITTTQGPVGYTSGFEIDMNPIAGVPEPGTLLLIGTGALGAFGWLRRRRMR